MRKDLNDIMARLKEQKNAKIKTYLQNNRLTMRETVELLKQEDDRYLPVAVA